VSTGIDERLAAAATALAQLSDLVESIARAGANAVGIGEEAERVAQRVAAACAAYGDTLRFSMTEDSVHVDGTLLYCPRPIWERVLGLAERLARRDVIELEFAAAVGGAEILSLATAISQKQPGKTPVGLPSLKLVRGEARAHDATRQPEAARTLHAYADAVGTLRELHAALARSETPSMRAVKRCAEQLARIEPSPAWLGLTTLAGAHRDDAGRAVQTAVVALAVARELTRDARRLAPLALAALLTDVGRPVLTALSGRSPDVDASLEAHVPAATACVAFASGSGELAAWRATVAFETAWLERLALLGPLHDGELGATVGAELLWLARHYLDGIAPRDGRAPVSPADALRCVLEREDASAALRTVFARALDDMPPGSVVELSTGEWAVVLARSAVKHPGRPLVRVITDGKGRAHARPLDLDLGAPTSAPQPPGILGVIPPSRARFNVARAFFGSL
jgi:hypothetical protein